MNQSLGAGESIIDPFTGALLRRITGAGVAADNAYTGLPNLGAFDDSGSANPWSITGSVLPGAYRADGTSPPKMYVPANLTAASDFTPTDSTPDFVNYVTVSLTATATGSGEDAKLDVCLTIDGVTCAPGSPNLQEVAFTSTSSTQTAPSTTPLDYMADWFVWTVPPFNTTDMAKRSNTVAAYNDSTGALTWTSGHYFDRKWTAGTRVWIGGSPYKLTSYQSSQSITIPSGLGLDNPTVVGQSFGLLIWKKTSTNGTAITVSNVTFAMQPAPSFTFWNEGYSRQCNPNAVTVNGESGYYCQLYGNNGFAWIGRTTGNVIHLGPMVIQYHANDSSGNGWNRTPFWNAGNYVWDTTRPASSYAVVEDSHSKYVLARVDYNGNNTDVSPFNISTTNMAQVTPAANLTPYNPSGAHYDVKTLLYNFDSRFAACYDSGGCSCVLVGEQAGYLLGRCYGGQDTPPAYGFVLDPSITPSSTATPVIALADMINVGSRYSSPMRWAVMHGTDIANYPWFKLSFNNSTDSRTETTLAQAITSTTGTDVYVSGEPGAGVFDIARVGDLFKVDGEVMRISAIPEAGSHWVVTRNYGPESAGAAAHSSGATVAMRVTGSSYGPIAWDYIDDPHGLNASGTTLRQDPLMATGHAVWGPWNTFIRLADDTYCSGALGVEDCLQSRTGTLPGALGQAPTAFISARPTFASVPAPAFVTEFHPSQVQDAAAASNQNWFTDSRPMIYGAAYGGTVTKVASTNNLYKTTQAIHPKNVPTIAACGTHPLLDVSPGPLTDAAADNWEYCIGAGCYAGALSTETYVNCPDRTYTGCLNTTSSGEDANGDPSEDVCIGDAVFGLGSPLVQIGALETDGWGRSQRVVTYSFQRHRRQQVDYVANGKAIPDGSWATLTSSWVDDQRTEMFLVKIPPYPSGDSVNRGTFEPLSIQLGSVPAGTDNIVVQFGYNPDFYCTSRQEACITNQSTINETTPFYWASEKYSGLPCASGCAVTIPAVPQRVVYYRVQYRNASGTVIATAATAVAAVP